MDWSVRYQYNYYDAIYQYADTQDSPALIKGTINEFVLKTSLFIVAMFVVRLLQMYLVPSPFELIAVGLICAGYSYAMRRYIQEFSEALIAQQIAALAGFTGVMVIMFVLALIF